jgi:hypothetical protein
MTDDPFSKLEDALKGLSGGVTAEPASRRDWTKLILRIVGWTALAIILGILLLTWSDLPEGFRNFVAVIVVAAVCAWVATDFKKNSDALWDALHRRLDQINGRLADIESRLKHFQNWQR